MGQDRGGPGRAEPASENIVWSHSDVTSAERAEMLGHGSATVWLTGLSGSGKSTIAVAVERRLVAAGMTAYVLDGDNVRHGLNRDLGFSPTDRQENIRRIGEVCRLFQDAGVVVLTAFISPYERDRRLVRELHPEGTFIEVYVDTPLEVCESRDVKGLYRRARAGEIPEFSGLSAPYEAPPDPELRLPTAELDVDTCVDLVVDHLIAAGVLPSEAKHP